MREFSVWLTKDGAQTIIDTLEIGAYNSHKYAAVRLMIADLEQYIKNYPEEA